ncbi:MAG: hypothetical protein U0836_11315 [Pirellulales bacterium]
MEKDQVLFVCFNGACSLMAAVILHKYAGDRFQAFSAAQSIAYIDKRTIQSLRLRGLDRRDEQTEPLQWFAGPFDYVFSLDDAVKIPDWMQDHTRRWPIPDPSEVDTLAAFEQARDCIEAVVLDWLKQFEGRVPRDHLRPPAMSPLLTRGWIR